MTHIIISDGTGESWQMDTETIPRVGELFIEMSGERYDRLPEFEGIRAFHSTQKG